MFEAFSDFDDTVVDRSDTICKKYCDHLHLLTIYGSGVGVVALVSVVGGFDSIAALGLVCIDFPSEDVESDPIEEVERDVGRFELDGDEDIAVRGAGEEGEELRGGVATEGEWISDREFDNASGLGADLTHDLGSDEVGERGAGEGDSLFAPIRIDLSGLGDAVELGIATWNAFGDEIGAEEGEEDKGVDPVSFDGDTPLG